MSSKSHVPVIPNDSSLMNTPPLKDSIHSRNLTPLHIHSKNKIPSTVSIISSNSSIGNTISSCESDDNYTIQSNATSYSPSNTLFQFSFDEEGKRFFFVYFKLFFSFLIYYFLSLQILSSLSFKLRRGDLMHEPSPMMKFNPSTILWVLISSPSTKMTIMIRWTPP